MAGYPPGSLVKVRPFTHHRDGDTVNIGLVEQHVFLEIPAPGLDILNWLSEGKSVGETAGLFESKHGQAPDIEDFLTALNDEGFLQPADATEEATVKAVPASEHVHTHGRSVSLHWLSPSAARKLVGWPVLLGCAAIMAAGVWFAVGDPGLMPVPGKSLLFPEYFAALTWATMILSLGSVMIHEIAHVVAARAAGVTANMEVGNQLYVLVAQTDMTGIWLAPKRRRYLAFTIGLIADATTAALLIALLWFGRHGYVSLPYWLSLLSTALVLTALIRVGWQFFFFLRTDGYYVFATAFNCKSLMVDTEDFLRNQVKRLRPSLPRVDQSAIPKREMRAIRAYSLIWIAGRFISVGVFFFAGLPVLWGYLYQAILYVTGGDSRFNSIDFATVAILGLGVNGWGVALWIRSLYRGRRDRRRRDTLAMTREAARLERLRETAVAS
ncbi:hypothetical protein [Dactylosporangium matsuzakiense]|uniref:Uncharacterized protein n=1 Tax=Dactylosporangium matsuzakiense TaxID=53360 RepID=A0A9W6NQG5_9ACTN|nr:hypothetical protein [Dactylosporangium matsuzakiense]UWZ42318.1 hypothetical protein Dmats_32755 [Dactylosporangium matsuzakiense]GLL05308.1 hypothetical protein GCM10017581_070550 [Dactylosporangium matsuzakiense]